MAGHTQHKQMIAYGPVPSRRLGQSLGINNIPPKACTYSCAYCQIGRTTDVEVNRRVFYQPGQVLEAVRSKVEKAREAGERIDYLTFVPDGEPTIDLNLGDEIDRLKDLGTRIAVITNASLIWRPDVQEDLRKADWLSLKVDTAREDTWRRVNRPHRALELDAILDGLTEFARNFEGELTIETMLIGGINDSTEQAEEMADFLVGVAPEKAYIAIPTRPPAEKWAQSPTEEALNSFYQVIRASVERTEYLIGYEGDAFAFTGSAEEDLLSITAVHPMREEAVDKLLSRAGADWSVADDLVKQGELTATEYKGNTYFLRTFSGRHGKQPS